MRASTRGKWPNPIWSSSGAPNAVNTQVNVMTHAVRARKERGAKIAAVDIYMNGTMEHADLPVLVKAGNRWRTGVRCHALSVPRRKSRLGLSGKIHRCTARTRSAFAHARSAIGPLRSLVRRSKPSSNLRSSSASTSALFSGSAMGFRVRAMARRTCTRPVVFLRSRVRGSTRVEVPSTSALIFFSSTKH